MTAPAAASARTVLVANPSADLYGSDRMLLEAVRAFRAAGDRVVVTCSVDGPLVHQLRETGAEVQVQPTPIIRKSMLSPMGMIQLGGEILSALPRMRKLIRSVNADIVFANTVTIPFWTFAARLANRPIVVYVHEAEASLSPIARGLLTTPLRWANGVVFNSQTSLSVCRPKSTGTDHRTRIVRNGVVGPAEVTQPRAVIDSAFQVLYVGRLSPRKGVDLVISAVAELRARGIDVRADIVGDVFPGYEWYETQLREQVASTGLDEHVKFVGFLPRVWDAIDAADVVLVPSRSDESFGNVVIEAMLGARPVVVADHTGLREAADGFASAVRVKMDDPLELAEGIAQIHSRWDHYRDAAIADAVQAETRFNTDRFRSEITEALSAFRR